MFTILREERETLLKIKTFTPENKIPPGLLSQGVEAIRGGKSIEDLILKYF